MRPPPFEELRAQLRRSAPSPAPRDGAKERVRAALERRVMVARRRRARAGYALVVSALGALVIGVVHLSRESREFAAVPPIVAPPGPVADMAFELASGARFLVRSGSRLATIRDDADGTALRLDAGEVVIRVPHREHVVEVVARDVRVRGAGAIFAMRVDESTIGVRTLEGVARVVQGGASADVVAGTSWPPGVARIAVSDDELARLGGPPPTTVPVASGTPAPSARVPTAPSASARPTSSASAATVAYREAKAHEREGALALARAGYARIASAGGEHAEDALFALGRLDAREDADAALETFARYRARYPEGRYARDVDVQMLAILVERNDADRVVGECDRFLALHRDDPRAFRFRLARASIFVNRGRCPDALEDLRDVRAEVAAPLRARCAVP